jgi:hypothetical protein
MPTLSCNELRTKVSHGTIIRPDNTLLSQGSRALRRYAPACQYALHDPDQAADTPKGSALMPDLYLYANPTELPQW